MRQNDVVAFWIPKLAGAGPGIPFWGTGPWIGTLAAGLLDIDFKSSILAVAEGFIPAGSVRNCR
ncbi:small multi-drug export protein [Lachnospiraceae bacterium 54-53]